MLLLQKMGYLKMEGEKLSACCDTFVGQVIEPEIIKKMASFN